MPKGKHVLVEKPLARTYDEAKKIIQLAEQSTAIVMSAMCLRYWPAWVFLREAIEINAYGKCLSLNFKRQTSFPGGAFYSDHNQCGGALLDLHVHDTDFVNYCLGCQMLFSVKAIKVQVEALTILSQIIFLIRSDLITSSKL